MEDFRILDLDPDPDPYNNSTGSASLVSTVLFQKLKLKKKIYIKKFGDPQKCAFLNFEIKNFKENVSSYFWFFIVLETIDAQMLFRSVFFTMHEKKVINFQKWRFWRLITFFWRVFKNTEQNNNSVFIVFKAESEPKPRNKICFGCFSLKTKNALFLG